MSIKDEIPRLYYAALGRQPDSAGEQYWITAATSGSMSLLQIADYFAASPEFVAHYGALSDDAFVEQLYQNILGRAGDQPGIDWWDKALAAGSSRGAIVLNFADSPENIALIASGGRPGPTSGSTPTPPATDPPPASAPANDPPPVGASSSPTADPPPATTPSNNITITTDTTLVLGTAANPYVTNDIIGADAGAGLPSLTVNGFIHAADVHTLKALNVGNLTTYPDGANGNLKIDGDTAGVGDLNITSVGTGSSTVEIGNGLPTGSIDMATYGTGGLSTLILDHMQQGGHLPNAIIGSGRGGVLELPGLKFDGTKFTTNRPDATSGSGQLFAGGKLELTFAGTTVFTLDSWHPNTPTGSGITIAADGNYTIAIP